MERIRAPSQQRGQDALDRLLTAGSELLAEFGYEGFTMTELSKRSGVSTGAMYWRIENKDALLHAIHQRLLARAEPHMERLLDTAHWKDQPLATVVDGAVREVTAIPLVDAPLMRALSLRSGADEVITSAAKDALRRGRDAFCGLLEPRLEQAGHNSPRETAEGLFGVVSAAIVARVTWPEYNMTPELRDGQFVDRLCRMAVADVESGLPGERGRPGRPGPK